MRRGGGEWFVSAGEQWDTRLAGGASASGIGEPPATGEPQLAVNVPTTPAFGAEGAVGVVGAVGGEGSPAPSAVPSVGAQANAAASATSEASGVVAAAPASASSVADEAAARNTMPVYSRLKARYEQGERGQGLSADLTRWLESSGGADPRRDEVMAMRLVVLAHHRANHETLHSLADFVDRHPGSMWRTDLLVQHARVAHRELGDCGVALESYRKLEAITAGADQARARVGLGLCLLETGDKKGAARAFEAALAAGVQPVTLRAEAEAACLATRGCVLPK